ncbi:MAG: sodium:proton antiporter [Verrucomicrobia bacterium]|nr:MAG: sodium:proton antiporter [Verrucomicrobiota bacterium]
MRSILGIVLATIGVSLWFWGGFRLAGKKSFLWKIHALGISDTIGSIFILAGLLVRSFEYWPHIILAMAAIGFWGTALSFVLARLGNESIPQENTEEEDAV